MSNPLWHENEIAQAYDEKFQLLEAARKEYEQSVKGLLETLRSELEGRRAEINPDEGMELKIDVREYGFARQTLEAALKAGDDDSRLQVFARFAVPWDGAIGRLQVGVATRLDEKRIRSDVQALRRKWAEFYPPDATKTLALASNWLYATELDLRALDLVETACGKLGVLIKASVDLAWDIKEECDFSKRMEKILETCRRTLLGTELGEGWTCKVDWWKDPGMHYVQIDQAGKPSFWVGFDVKSGSLMYGHNKRPGLAERFASAIRVPTETYGGEPAGTLMQRDAIETSSDEDVVQKLVRVFPKFIATLNQGS